jgi:hypothetical protein
MQDWTTRVGTGKNPGSDSENWRSEIEVRLDLRVGVRGRNSDLWFRSGKYSHKRSGYLQGVRVKHSVVEVRC